MQGRIQHRMLCWMDSELLGEAIGTALQIHLLTFQSHVPDPVAE